MPQRADVRQKIRELEEKVRIQQMENDQLAERAEDTLLLGLIAEQISGAEETGQVLASGLERISVLKDIPFCACCSLTGNKAKIVKSYLSFTDEDMSSRAIVLPETVLQKLAACHCLLNRDECRQAGLSIALKNWSFVSLSAICIPFRSKFSEANLFIFADDKAEDRLTNIADMLHRVTEMIVARMDNISLCHALQNLNRELDRKVEERTRDLQESENRFRQFFENEPEYCYMVSPDGRVLDVNRSALEVLAYRKEELVGKPLQTIYAPESLPKMRESFEKWKAAGKVSDVEMVILSKSGEKRTVLLSADAVKDAEGKVVHSISVQRDITERKQAEEAVKESRERFRNLVETTSDWVWEVNENGVYIYASPKVRDILGYAPEEVLGKSLLDFMPPEEAQRVADIFKDIAVSRKPFSLLENINLDKAGSRVVLETSGVPVFDDGGNFRGFRGIDRDITERKRAEEIIKYQAHHDLLTGLPNRSQLVLVLKMELDQADRHRRKVAVLHLDLDRFKVINDSLGRAVGDRLILAVAERLKTLIRKNDTLSRTGSDEFIILLAGINRAEDAAFYGRNIIDAMRKAFRIDGHEIFITASIGISIYPEDAGQAEKLLANADIAVSHVKKRGRNNYQFFNPAINVRTLELLLLENSLRKTIDRNELVLYYQPQINIRTGEIASLEALVRWKHADLGMLSPSEFIPVAEEIGYITSIDEWVLRAACLQIKAWLDAGISPLSITVNLSAQQFQRPTLVEMISKMVREIGLDPRYLGVEVTESTAMRDIKLAIPNLNGLHDMGVNLSIDDFGTGYSSLNYLKQFPVQTLKIDQSFIRGVAADPDDQAIVRAVIAMGHNLQMKIIAEGVETDSQLSFLRENGCDEVQGFLFSEARTAGKIYELIAQGK